MRKKRLPVCGASRVASIALRQSSSAIEAAHRDFEVFARRGLGDLIRAMRFSERTVIDCSMSPEGLKGIFVGYLEVN
ncbi:hypothetical protein [Labrys neptuniae]